MVTNREQYLKRHNLKGPQSLSDLARTSKVPLKILQQVYNRGTGAYKTNPSSVRNTKGVKGGPGKKLSKEQWSYARVYSFLNKLDPKGTKKLNHDLDLVKKI